MLTRRQLETISAIVSRRFTAFAYEALGDRALTRAELATLREAGIIRESLRDLVMNPIVLGRITALLPPTARAGVTYDQVLEAAKTVEMTPVEEAAAGYAAEHAGEYIRGIRDMVVRDIRAASTRAAEAETRALHEAPTAREVVGEEVSEAIIERKTISELRTALFDAIDNRSHDWLRVASTEINNAVQRGVYATIRAESDEGADQVVYKRPNPDACKHCKRLFLKEDGTPRIFQMSDLAESNVGLKAADWEPTIGSVHPWCHCQLQVIPEGFDFVKTRVVKEPFEFEGRNWKSGEIVDADSYAALDEKHKSYVGVDAVLGYTGETGKPDVDKSLPPVHGDDCFCEH